MDRKEDIYIGVGDLIATFMNAKVLILTFAIVFGGLAGFFSFKKNDTWVSEIVISPVRGKDIIEPKLVINEINQIANGIGFDLGLEESLQWYLKVNKLLNQYANRLSSSSLKSTFDNFNSDAQNPISNIKLTVDEIENGSRTSYIIRIHSKDGFESQLLMDYMSHVEDSINKSIRASIRRLANSHISNVSYQINVLEELKFHLTNSSIAMDVESSIFPLDYVEAGQGIDLELIKKQLYLNRLEATKKALSDDIHVYKAGDVTENVVSHNHIANIGLGAIFGLFIGFLVSLVRRYHVLR